METLEQNIRKPLIKCQNCAKNQGLITKYQNLIALLKKKADKSHTSSQLSYMNKNSIGQKTTSHTSFNAKQKEQKSLIVFKLIALQTKLKIQGFSHIKAESYLEKYKRAEYFLKTINQICKHKLNQNYRHLKCMIFKDDLSTGSVNLVTSQHGQNICQNANNDIQFLKIQNEKASLSHSSPSPHFIMPQIILEKINQSNFIQTILQAQSTSFVNKSYTKTAKGQESLPLSFKGQPLQTKNLMKKIFILEQQNFSYLQKIKNLDISMQEALNRQIKQSKKKTESLEMVAQQMQQKNEIITDLQQKIVMLQDRHNYQTNGVLEDELTTFRRQIEKLQKVNIKLDNDLRKSKEKLKHYEDKEIEDCKQLQKLKAQNYNLKESMFALESQLQKFFIKQKYLNNSCQKMNKYLEKIKNLQRLFLLEQKNHQNSDEEYNTTGLQKAVKDIEQYYKLELVFIYLYNVEDQSFEFQYKNLFDEEQNQVFAQVRNRIFGLKDQLNRKAQLMDFMEPIQTKKTPMKKTNNNSTQGKNQYQHDFQNDENCLKTKKIQDQSFYCNQNIVDGSIFEVLNQKRHNDSIRQINNNKATQRMEPQKNFTMKLLQMQLEKNKQIQKISQLKQKIMYLRNVVLNLIKSLELKPPIKNETLGILQMIFDVFEYSQEEKQLIFQAQKAKQKKFFGFI